MGLSISVGCAVRIAAQRRCGVNLHASVLSCRPPGKGWDSYPGLALRGLLQGRAPGPEVEYWVKGGFWNLWFIQMSERFSSRWVRGSHACRGSSWRLWKKGGFLGILYLRLAFPCDCYRQAVLRCLSSPCLCEWLALCCGVKPLLGQALFSGRGSSLAFAVLVCGVLLSWLDPLYFSTNCSSSSGCTPPHLFVCLFWHEKPELHLSWNTGLQLSTLNIG